MSSVFISYSRKDKVFARRLFESLQQADLDSWADWAGIPYSAAWWQEICSGIDTAENFLFIISPSSFGSRVCNLEVEYARKANKRIIPVVRREPDLKKLAGEWIDQDWEAVARENWAELHKLNFLFFRKKSGPEFECDYDEITREVKDVACDGVSSDADDFATAFQALLNTIRQDPEHVRTHTRLLVRAREWEKNQADTGLLLSGDDLRAAESWLLFNERKDPPSTPLHRAYISTSIAHRQATEARERRRQRSVLTGTVTALVIVSILGLLSFSLFGQSQTNLGLANERATEAANQAGTAIANANLAGTQALRADNNAATSDANALLADNNAATSDANAALAATNAADAIAERDRANTNAAHSESQRLAVLSTSELGSFGGNAELAALLALRGLKAADSPEAEDALLNAVRELYTMRVLPVNRSIFSPDGSRILMVDALAAHLYDTDSGDEIRQFAGDSGLMMTGSAYSPDGSYFVTLSSEADYNTDTLIQVWNPETGDEIQRFSHPEGTVFVRFGPRGRYLMTSGSSQFMVWNPRTGEEKLRLNHVSVSNAVFSADETQLYTFPTNAGEWEVWNIDSAEQSERFPVAAANVSVAVLSPDEHTLLTGHTDGSARLWDRRTGELVHELFGQTGSIVQAVFSPDGETALTISGDATVNLWDSHSGELKWQVTGLETSLVSVINAAFSPDSLQVAVGEAQGTVRIWDVASRTMVRRLTGHMGQVLSLAYSDDGHYLLTNSFDGTSRLWDLTDTSAERVYLGHSDPVTRITFIGTSDTLLSLGADATLRFWSMSTGAELNRFSVPTMTDIDLSADGRYALSASLGQTIVGEAQLVDLTTNMLQQTFEGVTGFSTALSPDARYVLTANGSDGAILWDAVSGEELRRFQLANSIFNADRAYVEDVAISSDAHYVAAVNTIGDRVRVWERESGDQQAEFATENAEQLVFSPDSTKLLTSGTAAVLWDIQTGELIQRFEVASASMRAVAFSPDGHSLVTGGADGAVRLWDAASGEELRVYSGHNGPVLSVAFSPDGHYIASGGFDQSIRVWSVMSLDAMIEDACHRIFRDFVELERTQFHIEGQEATCSE